VSNALAASPIATFLDAPALASAFVFAERVADLPVSTCLSIGASLDADADGDDAERRRCRASVDRAITERHLRLEAWFAEDAIGSATFHARHGHRLSRSAHHLLARFRDAAESAAIARLVAPSLSAGELRTLCRPFAGVIDLELDAHH
jgi:hypothetical protein